MPFGYKYWWLTYIQLPSSVLFTLCPHHPHTTGSLYNHCSRKKGSEEGICWSNSRSEGGRPQPTYFWWAETAGGKEHHWTSDGNEPGRQPGRNDTLRQTEADLWSKKSVKEITLTHPHERSNAFLFAITIIQTTAAVHILVSFLSVHDFVHAYF